jgi:hypothetical protein
MPQRQFNVAKQVTFALAATLTAVAREAQAASVASIESTFTVRNNWDKPSNAMGIKALAATKDDLTAAVATRADWLHEEARVKQPQRPGGELAIPTANVRRSKRDIIQRSQRPKALGAKAFVVKTRNGPVLAYRRGRGKNKQLVFLYRLKPSARIRKQSTLVEPTVRVFERRFGTIFEQQLRKAMATAR